MPLLTPKEACEELKIGMDTLLWHVEQGELLYVAVGKGKQRIRRRFDPEDIARFKELRRRRECPSIVERAAAARGSSTSGVVGYDFAERYRTAQLNAQQKSQSKTKSKIPPK